MRYIIVSNFQNYQGIEEKKNIDWEDWNLKTIMNSVHTAEGMALVKTLTENNDYFHALPKFKICEMNTLQVQAYI